MQIKNISRDLAHQQKLEEHEDWHRLVVKVILWKDGSIGMGSICTADKISSKEWKVYCKRIMKTNESLKREKVLLRLEETRKKIKKHGGFKKI